MPPGQPGLLTRKEYGALAAYILSSNGQKAPGRIAIGSESAEPAQLAAEKPNASTGDRPNLFGIETPEALAASAAIVKMALVQNQSLARRSEERRVGKECVSTGRSRGSPDH